MIDVVDVVQDEHHHLTAAALVRRYHSKDAVDGVFWVGDAGNAVPEMGEDVRFRCKVHIHRAADFTGLRQVVAHLADPGSFAGAFRRGNNNDAGLEDLV